MVQPTIAMINKPRIIVAGSPNQIMPITTVPIAPIPVQIEYAVPRGIDLAAVSKKYKLKSTASKKAAVAGRFLKPSTNLRVVVKLTSKKGVA